MTTVVCVKLIVRLAVLSFAQNCQAQEPTVKLVAQESDPHPLVAESRVFEIKTQGQDSLLKVQANYLTPLEGWSLSVSSTDSIHDVSASTVASAVVAVIHEIGEGHPLNLNSIKFYAAVSSLLETEFRERMTEFFDALEGKVKPKSSEVFTAVRDFYRSSLFVNALALDLKENAGLEIASILPGAEIGFDRQVIGSSWKQLKDLPGMGFVPSPSVVFVIKRDNPSRRRSKEAD